MRLLPWLLLTAAAALCDRRRKTAVQPLRDTSFPPPLPAVPLVPESPKDTAVRRAVEAGFPELWARQTWDKEGRLVLYACVEAARDFWFLTPACVMEMIARMTAPDDLGIMLACITRHRVTEPRPSPGEEAAVARARKRPKPPEDEDEDD